MPCLYQAFGGATDIVRTLAPHTDFFGIGDEIWRTEDPLATLNTFISAMS